MTAGTILAVLGVGATVFFGLWGVYIVIRRRYAGQLTLVVDDSIGLFDAIVRNFPDLAVVYRQKPVGHGLVLFKGTFLNSGRKDITSDMVEAPVTIDLPEDFKWLASKVISSSPNVDASVQTKDYSLCFPTALFRCSEYFRFEALAEVPIGSPKNGRSKPIASQLVSAIKLKHRIADTAKVRQLRMPERPYTIRRLLPLIVMPCLIFLLGTTGIVLLTCQDVAGRLHCEMPLADGAIVEVALVPWSDGTIRIRNNDYGIDRHVDPAEFLSRPDTRPKVVPNPDVKFILAMLVAITISGAVGVSLILGDYGKWRRLRRQIGLDGE